MNDGLVEYVISSLSRTPKVTESIVRLVNLQFLIKL